jgi:hypothetical protein
MEIGIVTNVGAMIVSIAALAVSTVFATRQLASARRSDDTAVALDWLTRELINDDFLVSEAYVLDTLTEEQSPELGVSGLPLDARAHVLRVGRYYASLGHLIVFGAIDERVILSIVHYRIYSAWTAIEPFAAVEREIRRAPFFAFFEHIACRTTEVDVFQLHRRLGLHTFATSTRAAAAALTSATQPASVEAELRSTLPDGDRET